MPTTEYTQRRGELLAAASWHAWGSRRAINAAELADARKRNQRELAELRASRREVAHA